MNTPRMKMAGMAVAGVLAGCTASMKTQTIIPRQIDQAAIAVLPVAHDDAFVFEYANDQLESLNLLAPGPLGTALSAVAGASRRAAFNDEFSLTTTEYAQHAQMAIVDALVAAGFEAIVVEDRGLIGGERKRGLLKSVPEIAHHNPDAVLESVIDLGFVASGRGQPYRPMVWLSVRLWGADSTILMQDRILFNALTSDDGAVITATGIRLHVPDSLQFSDRNAVLEAERADAALRFGVEAAAREIDLLLTGPWQ